MAARGRVHTAVLVKPKTLEAREFARPAIGPDDARLRIGDRVVIPGGPARALLRDRPPRA